MTPTHLLTWLEDIREAQGSLAGGFNEALQAARLLNGGSGSPPPLLRPSGGLSGGGRRHQRRRRRSAAGDGGDRRDHDADDNGSVDGAGPEFTYTSNAGFSGTDSFTVEVCDTATVSVDVAAFVPPAAPPADAGELTADPDSVTAGEKVTASGNGMRPGETVFLVLHSDPIRVGETTADDNGDFSSEVTIPDSTEPGEHTLAAYGENTALAAALTVTDDDTGNGGGNGGTGNGTSTGGGDGTGTVGGKKLALTGAAGIPLLMGVGSALFLAGCSWLLAARRTRQRNA